MPRDHLIHNIRHALSVVVRKIPHGWKNIQSIHLKTTSSIALPLFNSLPAEPKLLGQASRTEDRETLEMETGDSTGLIEDHSLLTADRSKSRPKSGSRKSKK